MRAIRLTSYKINSTFDLRKVASYFKLSAPQSWENSMLLGESQLAEVFKQKLPSKRIHLYGYGCIVFENFAPDETYEFINYLQLIIGELDYKMLAKHSESHTVSVSDENMACVVKGSGRLYPLSDGLLSMTAAVLSKSTALSLVEANVDILLDEAEGFIAKLNRGKLTAGARKYASIMADLLRFEYESAASIRIFDRPSEAGSSTLRSIYDELALFYELDDRYDILEKKASELRNIVRSYSEFRYRRQEARLIGFEIFLLALFPLFHFFQDLLDNLNVKDVLKYFFVFTDLLQKFNIHH